ncbi:hypothetical protein P618_200363 [Holospora obtusa F1]|uniref:Uncharacterized protein n=1 Tax=Holospora obtusa F1 TaxID=1399147 RepID=W6THQ3_HOLOB|nr:hypothetical protein P618_200363 [Holospora obtusa F1]
MESILNGNTKTTLRIRKETQNSVQSAAEIEKCLGIHY